ncbi:unnamed protein product, partial [Cladocopium goreaui]
WYKPEEHKDLLVQWISETADVIERTLHCIDVFGASGRVSKTWERAVFVSMLLVARPQLYLVIEQPCSSWAFKQDFMVELSTVYHKRTRTGWQGGKDLASSAYFTFEFCQALLRSWQSRDPCDGDLVTPDNTPMPMEASQGENSLASLAPAEEDGPIEIVINSDSDSDTPVTPMPEEASPGDDSLASPAPAEEDVITEKTEEEFQAEQITTDARFQSCGGNEDVKGFVLLTILCSCSAARA